MGYYGEYIDRKFGGDELAQERKAQLRRIAAARGGRDVLVYAADLTKSAPAPTSIIYEDLLPIRDQLSNLHGRKIDLILETPGGSGEVAEDIVRQLHEKYDEVGVIVPGWAKSSGTIMAMAGDEILMEAASGLGPIDAQLFWQGKVFSADALLDGMEKIKEETTRTGVLNKAYVPILQGISPGELQHAQNALDFAKVLVREWLIKYKFKNWTTREGTGEPVTDEYRRARAEKIAERLCDHKSWLVHGRSIKIEDLEAMGLRINNYGNNPELADAIRRYYSLVHITFNSNIYKIFETPTSQIYKFMVASTPVAGPPGPVSGPDCAFLNVKCAKCGANMKVQANLGAERELQAGCLPFPTTDRFDCPTCGAELDLAGARRQIELQSKKKIVPHGG